MGTGWHPASSLQQAYVFGARAVLFKQADGGLRPEQAIEQGRIGAQLGRERLRRLRSSFVEVIEYAKLCTGRQ